MPTRYAPECLFYLAGAHRCLRVSGKRRQPELLLDRIQSALRYTKEQNQKTVIYDDALDQIIRTETDIVHRLKSAISEETLEVWYQPIVHVKSGRFTRRKRWCACRTVSEASSPAGQVIAFAERGGLVEPWEIMSRPRLQVYVFICPSIGIGTYGD